MSANDELTFDPRYVIISHGDNCGHLIWLAQQPIIVLCHYVSAETGIMPFFHFNTTWTALCSFETTIKAHFFPARVFSASFKILFCASEGMAVGSPL